MPLVFVHGVATRRGSGYAENVDARDALFRRLALDNICGNPAQATITNPFWGDLGARAAWNHQSLPGDQVEALGADDAAAGLALADLSPSGSEQAERVLTDAARRSLPAAIDLLWIVATEQANADQAAALADLAVRAVDYADHNPVPNWLADIDNDRQFVRDLQQAVEGWEIRGGVGAHHDSADWESLGFGDTWDRLREGATRIRHAAGRMVGAGAVKLGRASTHRSVSMFLGDVLVYTKKRGEHDAPGPIPSLVIEALTAASAARSPNDARLVAVGHSMGGNILYDVLTHFRPDLPIDAYVTVGSQVGWFEELKQFKESDEAVPSTGKPKVAKPPGVSNWINIFDPQDILSFVAEPIFDGVRDFEYSTGSSVFGAHSAYFARPSFHRRLGERLEEVLA